MKVLEKDYSHLLALTLFSLRQTELIVLTFVMLALLAPVINQWEVNEWGLKRWHVICNLRFNVPQLIISIEEGAEAMKCPKCGSEDVEVFTISNTLYCKCGKCGYAWKTDL
jgi:DNA-directed RNA polymerase subunit M/transcription elongation factor TFIIS